MSVPRLIVSDFDRTILRHDYGWDARVPSAFAAARKAGIRVVIATARSPISLSRFLELLGFDRLAICFNGGWIGDLLDQEDAATTPIDRDLAVRIAHDALDRGASPMLYTPLSCYAAERNAAVERQAEITGDALATKADFEEIAGPILKVMVVDHREPSAFEALRGAWAGHAAISMSHRYLMEVVPAGVSKGAALLAVADRLDLGTAECAAVGDAENDLAMLRAVPMALTVANALPEIRQMARFVGRSCDEGGFADVIDWVLGQERD